MTLRSDPRATTPPTIHSPGDSFSCDAIATVIVSRVRDLGSFEVRRALPSTRPQLVGPFIYFDQVGPSEFLLGQGTDVQPHPHIGLSTVTYLFDGESVHRDCLGTALPIRPGELNWMTAGRGITHSERTGAELRQTGFELRNRPQITMSALHRRGDSRSSEAWRANVLARDRFRTVRYRTVLADKRPVGPLGASMVVPPGHLTSARKLPRCRDRPPSVMQLPKPGVHARLAGCWTLSLRTPLGRMAERRLPGPPTLVLRSGPQH